MEYRESTSKNYIEDEKGKATELGKPVKAYKFWKTGLIRKNEGGEPGKIVGEYITARIEVGGGPRQVTVDQLKTLLETEEPIKAPAETQRGEKGVPGPKMTIALGYGDREWKRQEIEEIIETVTGKKVAKDAGKTGSGDGPTRTRAARSKDDES